MEHIPSYPSIYNIGHKAAADLFDGEVVVEEKIDGSQFSFGVTSDGTLCTRSKGKDMHPDAPEAMFARACETAKALAPSLRAGWWYRGEYLQKPKHNSLAYARAPAQHVILFDVSTGDPESRELGRPFATEPGETRPKPGARPTESHTVAGVLLPLALHAAHRRLDGRAA